MSTTKSNFGMPWTIVGRFPDFETADGVRSKMEPGFEAKIHRQHELFAVKMRALQPAAVEVKTDEMVEEVPKVRAEKQKRGASKK